MKLARLKALSAQQWWILISSMVLLPAIAMSLRIKGFKWTRDFLQKRIPESIRTPLNALKTAQSIAYMVAVAARYGPYRANCLKRSLATWWLLQRRGISAEMTIGVNKDKGDFSAHAWVEYKGCMLVEADDDANQFSAFGPH